MPSVFNSPSSGPQLIWTAVMFEREARRAFMRRDVALITSFVLSVGLYAQHEAQQTTSTVQPLVDGRKTPELIEDRTAIKLFIISITEPPNPAPEQLARLRAKIRRMTLNPGDTDALVAAITASHNQLMEHKARADELGRRLKARSDPEAKQQLAQLSGEIESHTLLTYSNILRSLSQDGAQKLREHIRYTKTRVKIIPPPKM